MHEHPINNYKGQLKHITWIGVIVNVFLSSLKITVGILGNSHAVFADGVHSLSDLATDFTVLVGVDVWMKKPDEEHPYGHGLIENFITLIVGIVLFFIGVLIGYRAIISLKDMAYHHPEWVAFWAAFLSIVFKEILYRKTMIVAKRIKSSALAANAWHHRTDALSSIPVVIAVCIAIVKPGWGFIDDIGAVIVSVFIIYAGLSIIKGPLDVFIGRGCEEKTKQNLYDIALSVKGVRSAHKLRTRIMGTHVLADLHILVDPNISVKQGHDISEEVKKELVKKIDDLVDVIVHIEPYED
jgi:cation diffusion facilitator family transporter